MNLFLAFEQNWDRFRQYLIMIQQVKDYLYENRYKILAGVSFVFAGYAFYQFATDEKRIKLSAFLQALQNNQLDQVVIKGDNVFFKSQLSDWYYSILGRFPINVLFDKLNHAQKLTFTCQNDYKGIVIGPSILALGTILTAKFLNPRLQQINKAPSIVHNQSFFEDFYGSQTTKMKLKQIIQFLKESSKFKKLGARLRRGILLYGPPGTGKTMLARALANEANVPFIQTCASEFQEIYIGMGPLKVRNIFREARKNKNGCIVFIDQLDALGVRNDGRQFSKQSTATINQLLSQIDGFSQNDHVVVIGSTNRPQNVDPALIRAGRFDLKIGLQLPKPDQRKGIFKTLLRKKKVPYKLEQSTFEEIAEKSTGWSGADIQNLINESIYLAVRQQKQKLYDEDILNAFNQLRKRQ